MNTKTLFNTKILLCTAGLILSAAPLMAEEKTTSHSRQSIFYSSEFYYIAVLLLILVIAIYALSKTAQNLSKVVAKVSKKGTTSAVLLLMSFAAFSQTENSVTAKPVNDLPEWATNPDVYLLGFLFLMMFLIVYMLYNINIRLVAELSRKQETESKKAVQATVYETENKPSFLRKIYLRLVDSVPVSKEADVMLDHNYDGIRELDNNLPPWWKYGFYITIIFGVIYLYNYHIAGTGKLQAQEYDDEIQLASLQKEARMRVSADNITEENVIALTDAGMIAKGKETYANLCAACHRADGGGQVGPNLTDDNWLHGGGINNIFKTITYGVPSKGMLSWQAQLSPKQIQQVASYILTLKGTKPAGGKEPQGDVWAEETTTAKDTLKTSEAKK